MREFWSEFDREGFEMDTPLKVFTLKRVSHREDGVFSVFEDEGQPFCLAVENNKTLNPTGEYLCKRTNSPKFKDTFEITLVPNKTHVLFHWGNSEDDSIGCVILGELFDTIESKVDGSRKTAILSSKTTVGQGFLEFLARTRGLDQFKLVVMEATWTI